MNGGFEYLSNNNALYWNKSSSNVTYSMSYEDLGGERGAYFSIKQNVTDSIYQYVSLPAGHYTLSMSINTYNCKNAKVFVIARSLSNASRVFTEEVPVNEYYGSGCCSFTSTSFDAINYNQTGVENFEIMIKVIGGNVSSGEVSIGIDNIMLENNIGNSGYSMVEFGNFENYAINSSGSTTQTYANFWSGIGTGVSVISQGNPFGKVLTIAGNISSEKYVKQTVYRASSTDIAYYDYGEPYDDSAKTFLVSGFAKGTRQVANENSKFRIRVDIKYYKGSGVADEVDSRYLDFQTDCEDWQFISKSITTTDYELIHEIDIICEYTYQPGTAYFDNIAFTLSTDESVVTNEYYDNGQVWVKKSGYYTEIYEYDANKNLTRIANNRGEIHDYTYSATGNVLTEIYYSFYVGTNQGNRIYPYLNANPDGVITKTPITKTIYTYNNYGQKLTSDTFQAVYSGSSVVAESGTKHITSTNVYKTTSGSKIFGALVSSTDTLGRTSRYFYDESKGYLLAAIKSDEETGMCYEYDEIGNIKKVQPATYTSAGYSAVTNAESVTYVYNANQMLSTLSTDSTTYYFNYNIYGQNEGVSVGSSNNTIISYQYYEDGANSTLTENNGNGGKLREIHYANGFSVRYVYDEVDNIKEVWYTNSGVETKAFAYSYTALGQLYRFDNLLTHTATIYKYDSEGRLINYVEFDTQTDVNEFASTFYYNEQGRVSSVFFHEDYYAGSSISQYSLHYFHAYNSDGSLWYYTVDTDTTNGNINYEYDDYKRLYTKTTDFYKDSSYATRFTNTVTYLYKENGNNTSALISQYKTKVNSGTERVYSFVYDNNGNITQKTDSQGRSSLYVYDELGQLVREDDIYRNYTFIYEYDEAGNILYKKRYALVAPSVTPTGSYYGYDYTYGNSQWGDRLTAVNGVEITYDALGNPLQYYNGYTFTWTNANELSSANNGTNSVTYTYNDSGIRTSKTVNGVKHTYHLNGSQIISEEWGNNLRIYLYDAEGTPIGMQCRTTSDAVDTFKTYWYEKDMQGNVIGIYTDAGQKVVWYEYDAWGMNAYGAWVNSSTNEYQDLYYSNPFRYRGYYYDTDTGLYYLNSRYYDVAISRFISPDSISTLSASPMGLTDKNLYAYCDNNPVMRRDDGGMFWDTVFDVVSLCFSVADVIKNPDDPWAWVGLAADVVSLVVPFATGGGTIVKAATKVDDVIDTAKALDKASTVVNTMGDAGKAVDNFIDGVKVQKALDFTDDAKKVIKSLDHTGGVTKSTAAAGRQIHAGYKTAYEGIEGMYKEYRHGSNRLDFLDEVAKTIYELKPNNPRSIKQGINQLKRYNDALGGGYKLILELY